MQRISFTFLLLFFFCKTFAQSPQPITCTDTSLWMGTVSGIDLPTKYYTPQQFINSDSGWAFISPSISPYGYYWSSYTLKDTMCITSNFSVEFKIKAGPPSGISAYDTEVQVKTTNGDCSIGMEGEAWAQSYTSLVIMGNKVLSNSPTLIIPALYNWTRVKLEFKNNKVNYYINDSLLFSGSYTGNICNIYGLNMGCKGAGYLDWIKIRNSQNNIVYFENFSSCDSLKRFVDNCSNPMIDISESYIPCHSDTLFLYAHELSQNASLQYSWTGPNGFSSQSQNPIIVAPRHNASGMYYCTAYTNSCNPTITDSININVAASNITFMDTVICQGNSFLGHNKSGTYTDTLINQHGCDSIVTLQLIVLPPPKNTYDTLRSCSSITYQGKTYSANASVIDTLTHKGTGCDSVFHNMFILIQPVYLKKIVIDTLGCKSVLFNGRLYTVDTTLQDTLRSQYGCDSLYRTIHINIENRALQKSESQLEGCDSLLFDGLTYTQNITLDTILKGIYGCDSLERITHILIHHSKETHFNAEICEGSVYELNGIHYDSTGDYMQVFKTVNGCDSMIYLSLTVDKMPVLNILTPGLDNSSVCMGDKITFFASGATSYQWKWNDSPDKISGREVSISLKTPETNVWLSGENGVCQDSISVNLHAENCCGNVFIPNAFTPNGDGKNDSFGPIIKGIPSVYSLHIFNRYGQIVFQSSDYRQKWGGIFDSQKCNMGAYVYLLDMKCMDGTRLERKGTVLLIR